MGKSLFAAVYAVATVAVPLVQRGHILPSEWVQIAIAIVAALSVYITPMIPEATWTKSAVGATMAGLQILVTVIDGGLDGNDGLLIAFAVASALGIVLAPAESKNGVKVGFGSDYELAA